MYEEDEDDRRTKRNRDYSVDSDNGFLDFIFGVIGFLLGVFF